MGIIIGSNLIGFVVDCLFNGCIIIKFRLFIIVIVHIKNALN